MSVWNLISPFRRFYQTIQFFLKRAFQSLEALFGSATADPNRLLIWTIQSQLFPSASWFYLLPSYLAFFLCFSVDKTNHFLNRSRICFMSWIWPGTLPGPVDEKMLAKNDLWQVALETCFLWGPWSCRTTPQAPSKALDFRAKSSHGIVSQKKKRKRKRIKWIALSEHGKAS